MTGGGGEVTVQDELRARALRAFHAWSSPRISKPELLKPQPAEITHRKIARLLSTIVHRSLQRRSRSAGPKVPLTSPSASFDRVDLWEVTADHVKQRGRHVEVCPTCDGTAKAACRTCAGSHRVPCDRCSGRGRAISPKTGNEINCRSCKGTGLRACADCSTRGLATCSECDGEKRVDAWLELVESQRFDVQVEPDGAKAGGFRWASDGVDASLEEIEADAFILGTVSGATVTPSMLPSEHRAWVGEIFRDLAPKLNPGERAVAQSLTVLDVPTSRVSYSIGDRPGHVVFLGRRMLVLGAEDRPIARHKRTVRWARGSVTIGVAALAAAYFSRGAYFLSPASAVMAACAALAAVMFVSVVRRRSLYLPSKAALIASASLAVGAAVAGVVAQPRRGHAEELIAAGRFNAAEAEIDALGSPDDLANELTNVRIVAAASSDQADTHASRLRPPSAISVAARKRMFDLRAAEIQAAIDRQDFKVAGSLFSKFEDDQLSLPPVHRFRVTLLVASARSCIESDDSGCADIYVATLEREGFGAEAVNARASQVATLQKHAQTADDDAQHSSTAAVRIARLETAANLWAVWAGYSKSTVPRSAERVSLLDRARADLKREEAAERVRVAAAEREAARQAKIEEQRRIREERAAKQREVAAARAQAQRERARDYSPLRCDDGSLSPSCTCGRDSYRGCCSHHGGVDGCSVDN